MKRIIIVILITLALCGCNSKTEIQKPVYFYYPVDNISFEQGVIRPEKRESKGYENDAAGLMALYLHGPTDAAFMNPFPEKLTLRSFSVMNDEAILDLSKEFSDLTGLDHTLAVSAIAKTVFRMTNTQKLIILTEGNAEPLILSPNDLIFTDEETVPETSEE